MTEIFNQKIKTKGRKFLRNHRPEPEIILWKYIRKNQIFGYRFRRQVSIGKYIVDFYCPKLKLIIEIDGDSHFTNKAIEYDALREAFMKSLGLRILRFDNLEIASNIEGVILEIQRFINKITPSTSPFEKGRI